MSVPGDAEGDGGLQKSSYSGERPHKLFAQLSGDLGVKSAASPGGESGERPYPSTDASVSSSGSLSASEGTQGGHAVSISLSKVTVIFLESANSFRSSRYGRYL